jgi:hypothetical protein
MTIGSGYIFIYVGVGQTASGRSDEDTGLGQTVGYTVGDCWLGKEKEGGGVGEWGARRVDKQRPSQVRSGHSRADDISSGRFRKGRG